MTKDILAEIQKQLEVIRTAKERLAEYQAELSALTSEVDRVLSDGGKASVMNVTFPKDKQQAPKPQAAPPEKFIAAVREVLAKSSPMDVNALSEALAPTYKPSTVKQMLGRLPAGQFTVTKDGRRKLYANR